MTAVDEPFANASPRQFLRNAAASYANLVLGVVLSLVLTRVLLRDLGASTYGLWVVLLSIVGYLGLLDVGVSTAAVQRVARMTAVGDNQGLADVIRTASVFFSVSGGDRRGDHHGRGTVPRSDPPPRLDGRRGGRRRAGPARRETSPSRS